MKYAEKIYYIPIFRKGYNFVYRNFLCSKNEKELIKTQKFESILSLGLANLYFFEHIKDLFNNLKESGISISIITPTLLPLVPRKQELFNYLKDTLNLSFGKEVITHPYVKYVNSKVYLECAISTYHIEMKCKKFLYAHGMGGLGFGKDYEMIKYVKFYDGILLTGPMQKKALEIAAKIFNVKLPKLYEVGYLRGDRLLYKSRLFNKNNFLQKFNLESGVPIALYAPTWGEFASVKEWLDKVVKVCNKLGIYLFIKLHPLMITENSKYKTCGIDWKRKLNELREKNSYVRIWESQNLDEIMIASDFMITDVSGMAMEYMILEKPVIFLPAPKFFKIFGENRPEKWCRCKSELVNEDDLINEVRKILKKVNVIYSVKDLVYNRGSSLLMMKKILI